MVGSELRFWVPARTIENRRTVKELDDGEDWEVRNGKLTEKTKKVEEDYGRLRKLEIYKRTKETRKTNMTEKTKSIEEV